MTAAMLRLLLLEIFQLHSHQDLISVNTLLRKLKRRWEGIRILSGDEYVAGYCFLVLYGYLLLY